MKPKPLNLRKLREKFRLRSSEMAILFGVHYMVYRKWESGERVPNAAAQNQAKVFEWLNDKHPDIFDAYIDEFYS